MGFDAWNFKLFGGYQYYSLKNVVSLQNGDENDMKVQSYIAGVSGMFNFGPAYVGAQFQYGQNMGDARWGYGGSFKAPAGTAMTRPTMSIPWAGFWWPA